MILYLAHPVGADVDNNAARAVRWLHWLMARESEHTIAAPWLPYCAVWKLLGDAKSSDTGHPFRERVMRDNLAMVKRCDGVVLCGGRISPGMQREVDTAQPGDWIFDLTELGDEPAAARTGPVLGVYGTTRKVL